MDALCGIARAFARSGEVFTVRELGSEMLAVVHTVSDDLKAQPLGWLATAFAVAEDNDGVERVLGVANAVPDKRVIVRVATELSNVGRDRDLEELARMAKTIHQGWLRGELLCAVANGLAGAGRVAEASAVWRGALQAGEAMDKPQLAKVLASGAPIVARLDDGRTLWMLCTALNDVDTWWDAAK
jgi:hypothetical protein